MDKLVEGLEELRESGEYDIIKVYYQNSKAFSIKCIKDGQVFRRIRRGTMTVTDLKPR